MLIERIPQYEGIEDHVTPEVFFDLVGWEQEKMQSHPMSFSVNNDCYKLVALLTGILDCSIYSLAKGTIGIGTIALAKAHNILPGQVMRIMAESAGARSAFASEKMNKILRNINSIIKHQSALQKLQSLVTKYGNNRYTLILASAINFKEFPSKVTKLEIPGALEKECASFTNSKLHKGMFFLEKKEDGENLRIQVRIPNIVHIILKHYREDVEKFNNSLAQCYRAAFITGLYILSKWVSENDDRFVKTDEFCLRKLIKEIELILTDYY